LDDVLHEKTVSVYDTMLMNAGKLAKFFRLYGTFDADLCLVNDSISRELLLFGAESSHVKWHQKTLFWTSMS